MLTTALDTLRTAAFEYYSCEMQLRWNLNGVSAMPLRRKSRLDRDLLARMTEAEDAFDKAWDDAKAAGHTKRDIENALIAGKNSI